MCYVSISLKKDVYPLLGFAISLLQLPLLGIFWSAKEMSLKNARVISSLLKDAMVETLTSCTVVEDTVWV